MKKQLFFLLFCCTCIALRAQPGFARYFTFAASNSFGNTSFINCAELHNHTGYLLLASQYNTSYRNSAVIRTDTNGAEIWTSLIDFQQAQSPFNDINFSDIGELPNGNYYILGQTGNTSLGACYVIFVLDSNGHVAHYTALHDTQNITSFGNYPQLHIGFDSSLVVAVSEYERFGYYRLDQDLNLLSSAFYTDGNDSWGRDALLLSDTTMLISEYGGLIKTTLSGNIIWAKKYDLNGHIKSLYASPQGSIYAGGYSNNGPTKDFLAKFDASGNPLFADYYAMANAGATSAVWNIFPDGNHLMLYSDSIMFPVDTSGNVLGMGKTTSAYNFKYMKPGAQPGTYLLTGIIFQDSVLNWQYTLMKFGDNTQMGCLYPRSLNTDQQTLTTQTFNPVQQNTNIVSTPFLFSDTIRMINYSLHKGCPDNPLGVSEIPSEENQLTIFPNPAGNEVNFEFKGKGRETKITIIDFSGRSVYSGSMTGNRFHIETSSFAPGLYFVRLEQDGVQVAASRFCILR